MKDINYVIVSPRNNRGGSIVLWNLCRQLNTLGYKAAVYVSDGANFGHRKLLWKRNLDKFYAPIKDTFVLKLLSMNMGTMLPQKYKSYLSNNYEGIPLKRTPFLAKNTIVVYPDFVYGNPLKAKNVVRYLLYYNRFENDMYAYGKDDLFFCYREQFNDWKLNPKCNKLQPAYFDLDLYKRTNYGKREGTCYIVRKGKNRDDLPKVFNGPIIDDLEEKEKVKLFNQCEMCVSYDTQSAYSGIAALCGCLSIVVPEPGKKRNDYLSKDDECYGVAFGFSEDEIKYARNTAEHVKLLYERQNVEGIEEVKHFVNICEEYFKDNE